MGNKHPVWKAVALLLLCSSAAMAQPPGARDPFFDALREVHDENPDQEILELASHDQILKLLKIDGEELSELKKTIKTSRDSIWELRRAQREKPLPINELKVEIRKTSQSYADKAFKALDDMKKLDRLVGVFVQWRGYSSAATSQVAQRIGLEGKQLDEFRAKKARLWSELMDEVREEMKDTIRERDPDNRRKIFELMRSAKANMNAELKRLLSAEQQAKLRELEGESVENLHELLDRRQGSGRGGSEGRPDRGSRSKPN